MNRFCFNEAKAGNFLLRRSKVIWLKQTRVMQRSRRLGGFEPPEDYQQAPSVFLDHFSYYLGIP
jgi:hypothetical protein